MLFDDRAIEAAAEALCAWPAIAADDREHDTATYAATYAATDALTAAVAALDRDALVERLATARWDRQRRGLLADAREARDCLREAEADLVAIGLIPEAPQTEDER